MSQIIGSKSIVVNAPIDKVFENLTNPEKQMEWFVEHHELRDYTPPLGKGTTFKTVSKLMGRDAILQQEVIEFNPPNRQVLRYTGVGSGETHYICEEVEGGTKISLRFDANMSGILAKIMAPLIRRQMDKRMTADFQSFNEFIED
jgi:carbon monoxide dehydrogenase subunit G